MNNLKNIFLTLAVLVSMAGCQKFDDLEADPNRSTSVPPSLVLRGILKDLYYAPWDEESRWCQYWCSNYNYYDNNEYWTGSADLRFTTLKNVQKMEDEAKRINLPDVNAYSALANFFRAYFYYDMTMKMGDLPLSQALQGDQNIAPAYDSQKDIFKQILVWLDAADAQLQERIDAADNTLQGDIYYNGDLRKWQKAVNAFKLRVLVQLSLKAGEADLNLAQQFAATLSKNLMESNDDNMSYLYGPLEKYPFNQDNFGFYALRYNTSATYVNTLSALHDPRVFAVAEPAAAKLAAGYTAADYEAYVGAPSDESLDAMATKVQTGEYSLINKARFFSSYEGEPCIQIGYPEMCFNIAEGINRGWASGNATDWYNKGIAASMTLYGVSQAAVDEYLAQPVVAYKGNNTEGLSQVLAQKYLALAQHSGLEAYYNWRRTGVPTFYQGGPGTGNLGVIPMRFKYPTSERDNNTNNYNLALTRQGNPGDDVNFRFWLIQ